MKYVYKYIYIYHLTLTLIFVLIVPFSTANSAVFFSEMVEGSASNKAIEIYNGNITPINLSNYQVERYNNGSTIATDIFDFTSSGFNTMLPGEVFVIANPSANTAILTVADITHSLAFYNGDDALVLRENGIIIDVIGVIGVDPGSGWPVGTGATNNSTLIRHQSKCEGQTNWSVGATEWDAYTIDFTDDLGLFIPDCQPISIMISEYVDGSNQNQAIELYNPGPFAIDYRMLFLTVTRDGGLSSDSLRLGNLVTGYFRIGEIFVVINPNATATELLNNATASHVVSSFDGNDGFRLLMTSPSFVTLARDLDQIGQFQIDPGVIGWPVTGGTTNDTTLIRQEQYCSGNFDWTITATQWNVLPQDSFGDLGIHTNSDCGFGNIYKNGFEEL